MTIERKQGKHRLVTLNKLCELRRICIFTLYPIQTSFKDSISWYWWLL